MKKEILAATGNLHKIEEIKDILKDEPIIVRSPADISYSVKPEESGASYEENSAQKARFYAKKEKLIILADDSGLEIDFLSGKPGINSARFLRPDAPFEERNRKILELLKGIDLEKRKARFVCVVTVALNGSLLKSFRGELNGYISDKIKGEFGFGYDPIFFVPEYGKNLAELPAGIKNLISHRAKALKAAAQFIREMPGINAKV